MMIEHEGGVTRVLKVTENFREDLADFFTDTGLVYPFIVNKNADYIGDRQVVGEMWDSIINKWIPIREGNYISEQDGIYRLMTEDQFLEQYA